MTNRLDVDLKIQMWDTRGNYREANYGTFRLAENENFTLVVDDFATDDKAFVLDGLVDHANGKKFSTYDRDNDDMTIKNCAEVFESPGW